MKLTKKNTVKSVKSLTMIKTGEDKNVRHYVKIGSHWYGCWVLNAEATKVVADFNG